MRRKLAIVICLLFLASGVLRMGVSGIMIGQTVGWWELPGEAAEALADTQRFISEQRWNIVGFTPISYFAFIGWMGIAISLGAIGQLWQKRWGLALIVLYLISHGWLFINFGTVNPKIAWLALASLLTVVLALVNRPDNLVHDRPASGDENSL